MKNAGIAAQNALDSIARMPSWISLDHVETLEDIAFLSGAALSHLNLVGVCEHLPHAVWRARLALAAAEACMGFLGRCERAAELRDAVHLARSGDHPGPAGEIFQQWGRAVARPISITVIGRALPSLTAEQIASRLDVRCSGNPVDRAAGALEAILTDTPRAETTAIILADVVLARALGWDHVLPLLAAGLRPLDLRKKGVDLRRACHQAIVIMAGVAVGMAADLAHRGQALRAAAPKLRAKGAGEAVALFLARDALAPAALAAEGSGLLSDRAARRLCDRLVALGVLRELTGRDSFRLYGV